MVGTPIANHGVAVGETTRLLKNKEFIFRRVLLGKLPDDLALFVYLQKGVRTLGDQGIAVLQPRRRPGLLRGVGPDFFEVRIIFYDFVVSQMRGEERALFCLMHPAELDVRAGFRIQHRKREFLFCFARAGVDEHQLRRIAVLGHEHAVQADRLDRMNLRALRRIDVPDDFLVRSDFARADLAAEDDVAVGKHGGVAQLLHRAGRIVERYPI